MNSNKNNKFLHNRLSMAWLVFQRFWVILQHFWVIFCDDTVQTLFLVWWHLSGSVIWDELNCFVDCFWWCQECHQVLDRSGGSWWGTDSVQEQLAHCLLVDFCFLSFLLLEFWSNVHWVVKAGFDVWKSESCTKEEEDKRSSQLNKLISTLPSDLASLKILSVIFPMLLCFIIPISSWLNLRLPRLG